jgi:hypothetical protein
MSYTTLVVLISVLIKLPWQWFNRVRDWMITEC